MLRHLSLAGLTVLFGVALPAVADASTASRSGSLITVTADPGETNGITIEVQNFAYVKVTDTAGVTPTGDCSVVSATEADCGAQQYPDVNVSLGDGNDTFRVNNELEFGTFNVDGGTGDDNLIQSGKGTIHGGPGNDYVGGSDEADQVYGDAGNDTVRGFSGNDLVDGGPGQDLIEGDGGGIYTDGGSDTIMSRDGEVDRVTCGYGTDSVTADPNDVLEGGGECEAVDAGASGPSGGGGGGGPLPTPLTVAMASKSSGKLSKLLSHAGFTFAVRVSDACHATAKITVARGEARKRGLAHRAVTLASVAADIPAAGDYSATLHVAHKYRAKLRHLAKLHTTVSFSCTSAAGTQATSKRVTFGR